MLPKLMVLSYLEVFDKIPPFLITALWLGSGPYKARSRRPRRYDGTDRRDTR